MWIEKNKDFDYSADSTSLTPPEMLLNSDARATFFRTKSQISRGSVSGHALLLSQHLKDLISKASGDVGMHDPRSYDSVLEQDLK